MSHWPKTNPLTGVEVEKDVGEVYLPKKECLWVVADMLPDHTMRKGQPSVVPNRHRDRR